MLGICFNIMEADKTVDNVTEKLKTVKNILSCWGYKDITYIRKTTVIKTLALSILVQALTALPTPPPNILRDIQNTLYNFLWDGKPDTIKRMIILNYHEEGGLQFPHVEFFCKSLKMSWLKKWIDPMNISPRKTLLLIFIAKYGDDRVLYLNSEGLGYVSKKVNPFWRDI